MADKSKSSKHTQQAHYSRIRGSLQHGVSIIQKYSTTFIGLQVAHHAILLGSMGLTALLPSLSTMALAQVNHEIDTRPGAKWIMDLYDPETGNTALAGIMTFIVNMSIGAFGTITLPSLIIPGAGLALQAYRATIWGMLFSPGFASRGLEPGEKGYGFLGEVPHLLTVAVEGQAYVIAALGSYILMRPLIRGVVDLYRAKVRSAKTDRDAESRLLEEDKNRLSLRWAEYKAAAGEALGMYGIIGAVLTVAAAWEVYEVIHLVPMKATR